MDLYKYDGEGNAEKLRIDLNFIRGPPLHYYTGGGLEFLEINIFVGKMGEIMKIYSCNP